MHFSGIEDMSGIAGYVCTLETDGTQESAPCTNPHELTGLSVGTYTFSVAATDVAGNADQTPATHTFTVDQSAPVPNVTFDPPANEAGWHNSDVNVFFNWVDEPGGSGINDERCMRTMLIQLNEGDDVIFRGVCDDHAGNQGDIPGSIWTLHDQATYVALDSCV